MMRFSSSFLPVKAATSGGSEYLTFSEEDGTS